MKEYYLNTVSHKRLKQVVDSKNNTNVQIFSHESIKNNTFVSLQQKVD